MLIGNCVALFQRIIQRHSIMYVIMFLYKTDIELVSPKTVITYKI